MLQRRLPSPLNASQSQEFTYCLIASPGKNVGNRSGNKTESQPICCLRFVRLIESNWKQHRHTTASSNLEMKVIAGGR